MMNKLFFFLIAIAAVNASCRYTHGKRVSGNGHRSNEQRNVTGFTGVETHGSIDIVALQGDYSVKVEADQNLLQYIETNMQDGRLIVRFKEGISLYNAGNAKVVVSAPELNALETHGSGNISSQGKLTNKNKMNIYISGSGDIQLEADCPDIRTETHGSGNITLQGNTKTLSCKTSGSGDIKAADLKAESVTVSIHGSGDNEVFASESLDIEIFGSGDVHYRGQPKISTAVHGSGAVSKMN